MTAIDSRGHRSAQVHTDEHTLKKDKKINFEIYIAGQKATTCI